MSGSFQVAANVVLPMILLMLTGAVVVRCKVVDRPTMKKFDQLIFRLFLPAYLFQSIYSAGDTTVDWSAVLFAWVTMTAILLVSEWLVPRFAGGKNKAASLIQALVRANFTIYVMAVTGSVYGEPGQSTAAAMSSFIVPFTSMLSVIVLERNRSGSADILKTAAAVVRNPLIVAALLAYVLRGIHFVIPPLIWGCVKSIGGVASTVSFLSLGIGLNMAELGENRKQVAWGTVIRMFLIPAVLIPIAVLCGFRGAVLCSLMVLYVSPAAINSYPMAVAMGADGPLAGQLVCVTTVVSMLTVFLSTFMLHSMGFL